MKRFWLFTWYLQLWNILDMFCFFFSTVGIKQEYRRCSSIKRSQKLLFWRAQEIQQ
jgi:hypothetical protein